MTLSNYLSVFGNRRVAIVLLLGFASGLPLALTAASLQAWLTVSGVDITTIGWFTLVGLPYTFKFLWSPLLDRFEPTWLGRRRGWLVLTQLALAVAIFAMSLLDPVASAGWLAVFGVIVAFLSASQDVVFDAYRTELLQEEERGAGAAVTTLGYRLAMLTSGALALIIAEKFLGWNNTYKLMAVLMAGMALVTLFGPRLALPEGPRSPAGQELKGFLAMLAGALLGYWLASRGLALLGVPTDSKGWALFYLVAEVTAGGVLALWLARQMGFPALLGPLDEFISRKGAWAILALIIFYKLGDAFAGSLTTAFLLRGMGFSQTAVGEVNKVFGLLATLVGAVLGGLWMVRLGLWRALMLFGALQAVSNLMYWWLSISGQHPYVFQIMVAAVGVENLCGGMGTAAFVALLMTLCNARYTATQFALLSALAAFGRVYVGPASGVLVDQLGWSTFFVYTVLAALPGLLLLWWLRPRIDALHSPSNQSPQALD